MAKVITENGSEYNEALALFGWKGTTPERFLAEFKASTGETINVQLSREEAAHCVAVFSDKLYRSGKGQI